MTEQEWLECRAPQWILSWRPSSQRKVQLWICACTRRIWNDLSETNRKAVEMVEREVDDPRITALSCPLNPTTGPAMAVGAIAYREERRNQCDRDRVERKTVAELAVQADLLREVIGNPFQPARCGNWSVTADVLSLAHAAYEERAVRPHKRCVCGRAYEMISKKSTPPLAWCGHCRTDGGRYADAIAQDDGTLDPARLAVLSDAIEEAGGTDTDILAHLRSPGPHVRGCWALDLILGKE